MYFEIRTGQVHDLPGLDGFRFSRCFALRATVPGLLRSYDV